MINVWFSFLLMIPIHEKETNLGSLKLINKGIHIRDQNSKKKKIDPIRAGGKFLIFTKRKEKVKGIINLLLTYNNSSWNSLYRLCCD